MRRHAFRPINALLVGLAACALVGCMDITGRGPAPLTKTIEPHIVDARPRVGHVYCMRGWLGIFSTGIDDLANLIDKEVPAVPVADEEWRRLRDFIIAQDQAGNLKHPLILVGHSYGADDSIRVAAELAQHNIKVDLLVTLDPVTPPKVPGNVGRMVNIYKSHPATDSFPFWRGIEITPENAEVPVTNINLREAKLPFDTQSIDHINIEKTPGVHAMVLEEIRKVCPPRTHYYSHKNIPTAPARVAVGE